MSHLRSVTYGIYLSSEQAQGGAITKLCDHHIIDIPKLLTCPTLLKGYDG